jgi:hypothetical protein
MYLLRKYKGPYFLPANEGLFLVGEVSDREAIYNLYLILKITL